MHFKADPINSMATDFLVLNVVPICSNLNTEFIDLINQKIGTTETEFMA